MVRTMLHQDAWMHAWLASAIHSMFFMPDHFCLTYVFSLPARREIGCKLLALMAAGRYGSSSFA
jgi:hypothetical protein